MTTNQPIACCANGHQQPLANSKFCIHCGAPVSLQNSSGMNPPIPPAAPSVLTGSPNTVAPSSPIVQKMPGCCHTCGGDGSGLELKRVVCPECRWLRPLVPGYQVDASAFAWAGDARAMAALRSIRVLTTAAAAVSEKVGRRWIEVTFNGIRLGEKQMPQIYSSAVRAARVLGMSHMPDIYLSGERPWEMLTFGTDRDSFIVIGSAIAANFQGPDMYFLLARQLGHCKAGHSLWKTVIRFLLGEQGPQKGIMGGGVLNTVLNPTALLSSAIEMPLLGWARQAEITADRAGMLAIGNVEIARRVLMSWSLKSSHLYQQLNMNAWVEQQSLEEDQTLRLSELLTTSTPYLGPRLKLLQQYATSPEFKGYLRIIGDSIRQHQSQPTPVTPLRLKCTACGAKLQVPKSALYPVDRLPIRCPNTACGAITLLEKQVQPTPFTSTSDRRQLETMTHGD